MPSNFYNPYMISIVYFLIDEWVVKMLSPQKMKFFFGLKARSRLGTWIRANWTTYREHIAGQVLVALPLSLLVQIISRQRTDRTNRGGICKKIVRGIYHRRTHTDTLAIFYLSKFLMMRNFHQQVILILDKLKSLLFFIYI